MNGLVAVATQIIDALTFLSRLPVSRPSSAADRPSSPGFLRFAPLAGLVIGSLAAVVLAAAVTAHVPSFVAGALAVTATMLATGGLHEDGLADVADGFGGGRSREGKLAIMRDSRIGAYGAGALTLALIMRSACLGALIDRAGLRAAVVSIVVAASVSRTCMLLPMAVLDPARTDGLARSVGRLSTSALAGAGVISLAVEASAWMLGPLGWHPLALTTLASAAAALVMVRLARRQIGGVTGDVIGATQQVAEIVALISLSAAA